MRRKAFTLIELLVVIAIIAILAAILFPVFAQAKEAAKKTQTLSNCKQYGTAVNLYADSADDLMPLAMYISTAGTHFYNTLIPIPAGWFTGGNWATPNAIAGSNVMWGNSMFQYVKSGNLLEVAGAQKSYFAPDDVKTKVKEPYVMGLAYNGMLHAYSMSAAAAPSVNPAFWSGWGKMNSVGRALSNPTLECSGKADCRFIPGEQPQADGKYSSPRYGDAWFWGTETYNPPASIYGQNSAVVVRLDSSARVIPITAPGTKKNLDPNLIWTEVDAKGVPQDLKACKVNKTDKIFQTAYFRPDYDGSGRAFFQGGCDEP